MTVLQGAAANFGCGWYYVHTAFFISISYIIVIPLDVAGAMCAQRLRNKMLMLTAKSITAATCVVTAAIARDICAGMAFTPLPFPLGMVCAVVVFGRLPLTVTTVHAADARSMPPLLTCAAAWHLLRYSTAISS